MPFRLPCFPATRHRLVFLRAGAWLAVLFGGVWRIDLQARAAVGARAMIGPLLRTPGQPLDRAAGSYRIRWPAS